VVLGNGARSVIDNSNLVKKVYFPREILPLATVGVGLVDFVLQSSVLLLFMLVSGYGFHLPALVLYPLSFITLVVFTVAMTLWVAAVNVRYRDVQHLIGLALLVWFWFTPIVYPGQLVQDKLTANPVLGVNLWNVFVANPLAAVVLGFQRALYWTVTPNGIKVLPDVSLAWLTGLLVAVLAGSTLFLLYTWRLFFRLAGDFAEEL